MIKGWNRTINDYLMSFHLEVIVLQVLERVKISDYPSGTRYVFDKGRSYVKQQNPDPAGYGGDVGSYLSTQEKLDDAAGRFETAYDRAIKAEDFDRRGRVEEAVNMWRKIFGDYFPAYG